MYLRAVFLLALILFAQGCSRVGDKIVIPVDLSSHGVESFGEISIPEGLNYNFYLAFVCDCSGDNSKRAIFDEVVGKKQSGKSAEISVRLKIAQGNSVLVDDIIEAAESIGAMSMEGEWATLRPLFVHSLEPGKYHVEVEVIKEEQRLQVFKTYLYMFYSNPKV